jgi:ElaB/YqjD/DUF883 family membrane-anchored ribosome-binding protein
MGSKPGKPDAIDQEIRASRENIGRRIEELQSRLQKDVRSVRRETRGQAQQMMGGAGGQADLNKLMNERPLGALAGAAGVGAFLGFISNSVHMPRRGGRNRANALDSDEDIETSKSNGGRGNGLGLAALLATVASPVTDVLRDELRDLMREGVRSIKRREGDSRTSSADTSKTPGY